MAAYRNTFSPAEIAHEKRAGPRPGAIWREALPLLQDRLLADGFSEARAMELGECALIAGALHHVPKSVEEACAVALKLMGRSFDQPPHGSLHGAPA
jgi:hypothetical protein